MWKRPDPRRVAASGSAAVLATAGPGTHFMLTPSFEIGCRMGWGLTRDAAGYFVDTGVGWRF